MSRNLATDTFVEIALKQNEDAQNDPNTPESVRRVLAVQELAIRALDALLNRSDEELRYILTQLNK